MEPGARVDGTAEQAGVPRRFGRLCAAVAARLPFGLARLVPPTLVGFAAINSSTFALDLVLLTVLHQLLLVPYPVAVGVGYAAAFAVSFVLNRVLNFRSHAPVGRQSAVYVGVVAVNFALLVGASSALEAAGMQYQLARVTAGVGEAVFLYCAMRWIVFRAGPTG